MTLDRDINHSLSEKASIRVKASKLFRHLSSVELFGFDRLQKVIIYLFFYYLIVKDKNNEEIKKKFDKGEALTAEDLTDLAYSAMLMEIKCGMEEDEEVFSFIFSLKDRLSDSKDFLSSIDLNLEAEDDFQEFISFVWRRYISRHLNYGEVKLSESILSITDDDYVFINIRTIAGLYVTFGKNNNCDVLYYINNKLDRTFSKMLFFMMVPKEKRNRYRFIKERSDDNLLNRNKQKPNKIISFGDVWYISPNRDNCDSTFDKLDDELLSLIKNGDKALILVPSKFLAFRKGYPNKCREQLYNLNSSISILSFERYFLYSSIIILDSKAEKSDDILMLHLEEPDIVLDDETCSEISAALSMDEEKAKSLKNRAFMVKRSELKDNDYMFYPPFYIKKKVDAFRKVSDIDNELNEKYRELRVLCRRMSIPE
ncbi:hypothetical protein FYJ80_10915 [Spirochaetales bacterium NM-380-WT-3C1]|uniref:Uncharacterized protein n=1 Tax=Bullifex porci TaxID=2606638 RepID=A0A7X2TSS4_9SPIO|nr:hypothetical protein [Bullifex porci]MSU07268.1 hypothetical protein [Bullifex porci]